MRNSLELMPFAANATRIVAEETRADARYKVLREELTRRIVVRCLACDSVEAFKVVGGRNGIAQHELDAILAEHAADARASTGSEMFPFTVGACITMDLIEIKREAYRREFNAR